MRFIDTIKDEKEKPKLKWAFPNSSRPGWACYGRLCWGFGLTREEAFRSWQADLDQWLSEIRRL